MASQSGDLTQIRRNLLNQYAGMATPSNVYQIPGAKDKSTTAKFPVQLGGYNMQEDKKWAIRSEMVGNTGAVEGVGMAVAPESYFDYVNEKDQELITNEFLAWVMDQTDFSNPAQAAWWNTHFPFIKQKKLEYAKKQHELDWKLTELAVNGPQDMEDMMIIYMMQQGILKPPEKPTYKLNETTIENNYIAGLFSPLAQKSNLFPKSGLSQPWASPFPTAAQVSRIESGQGSLPIPANQQPRSFKQLIDPNYTPPVQMQP